MLDFLINTGLNQITAFVIMLFKADATARY